MYVCEEYGRDNEEEMLDETTSSLGFRVRTRRRVMARNETKVGWMKQASDCIRLDMQRMWNHGLYLRRRIWAQGRCKGI